MYWAENISNLEHYGKRWAEFPACSAVRLHLLLSFFLMRRARWSGAGGHEPAPGWPTWASAAGEGGAQSFHRAAASAVDWALGDAGHVDMAKEYKRAGQGLSSCCTFIQRWQQGGPWTTAGLRHDLGYADSQSSGDGERSKWEITGYHLDWGDSGQVQRGRANR